MRRHTRDLVQFTWFEYTGDPLLPLSLHRAFASAGVEHTSLTAFRAGYSDLMSTPDFAGALSNLILIQDLLGHGSNMSNQPAAPPKLPSIAAMVASNRTQILELCRVMTVTTSCGRRPLGDAEEVATVLPMLCFSYARDWDIETACALIRTCAYLKAALAPPCQWAKEWLLDQQQSDGSFGLLVPESRRLGRDPSDPQLYFGPTVQAVWALAELNRLGFILEQ